MSDFIEVGTVFNEKWIILEFIAKGGMGEVYQAHQINLKRDVAIKVISREFLESCEDNADEYESGLERFSREVQLMAQIRHPNVLQIFDYGSASFFRKDKNEVVDFIVMEYIPGESLRDTMSEEGFHPEEDLTRSWLAESFFPLLNGVEAMHNLDIIHRDLKPENVLMDRNTPKITDFGLARSSRWKPITQSMDFKGTFPYMSPEHFFDFRKSDQRSDIYSLGKMIFEAIDGKMNSKTKPFKTARLPVPGTPFFEDMNRIIEIATHEDRGSRFQSVSELRDALANILVTEPVKSNGKVLSIPVRPPEPARKKRMWEIFSLVCSIVIVTTWFWFGGCDGRKRQFTQSDASSPAVHKIFALAGKSEPHSTGQIEIADGVTLHIVPGGEIDMPGNLPAESGKQLKIEDFRMDETQVLNHQYVEFLNQMLPEIKVEDRVVRGRGNIWLMLGNVKKGYEPIVYENGRFHLTMAEHASCPVLRVSGYGASAYAAFYGRRLPDFSEWMHALKKGGEEKSDTNGESAPGSGMHGMGGKQHPTADAQQLPFPVLLYPKNALGIRGLNRNLGEWGFQKDGLNFIVMGKMHGDADSGLAPISRQPWEAFDDVGFRCVISAAELE